MSSEQKRKGLAAMPPEKRKAIAAMGGRASKAAHRHEATPEGTCFGMLTTLETSKHSLDRILCRCGCGVEKRVRLYHLKDKTRSCGCILHKRFLKHGKCKRSEQTPSEYGIWASMRTRCMNAKSAAYKYYGGRGIKVCERWDDFANFYADMGPRPSLEHTLDRYPDNNGNYEPGNCRWGTDEQQRNNKRNTRWLELDGVKKTAGQWAPLVGIPERTIRGRIQQGWSDRDALTTPWSLDPNVTRRYRQSKASAL